MNETYDLNVVSDCFDYDKENKKIEERKKGKKERKKRIPHAAIEQTHYKSWQLDIF